MVCYARHSQWWLIAITCCCGTSIGSRGIWHLKILLPSLGSGIKLSQFFSPWYTVAPNVVVVHQTVYHSYGTDQKYMPVGGARGGGQSTHGDIIMPHLVNLRHTRAHACQDRSVATTRCRLMNNALYHSVHLAIWLSIELIIVCVYPVSQEMFAFLLLE